MKLTNTIKNTIVSRVRAAYDEIHGKKFIEAKNAFMEELYYHDKLIPYQIYFLLTTTLTQYNH